MSRMIDPLAQSGRVPEDERPGTLQLITGSLLNPYRALDPGDAFYEDFAAVWRQQKAWDRETHVTYWRAALRVWPVHDGQVRRCDFIGAWVWSWRRFGLSDKQIADRLGYPLDTLRRRGALRYADWLAQPRERRWVRVPLVVAVEQEEAPHPFDTWVDTRISTVRVEAVERVQAYYDAITRDGPRGRRKVA